MPRSQIHAPENSACLADCKSTMRQIENMRYEGGEVLFGSQQI
jgi:hypothetical protein